ncbi:hypothetical protein BJ166DRAFT_165632 [Pestalotiopsis sp. NC0098]|nr:hypothetical protein BJ166DRAFT_165632 [Pestalotiopsis sp. NC0098]
MQESLTVFCLLHARRISCAASIIVSPNVQREPASTCQVCKAAENFQNLCDDAKSTHEARLDAEAHPQIVWLTTPLTSSKGCAESKQLDATQIRSDQAGPIRLT